MHIDISIEFSFPHIKIAAAFTHKSSTAAKGPGALAWTEREVEGEGEAKDGVMANKWQNVFGKLQFTAVHRCDAILIGRLSVLVDICILFHSKAN